VRLWSHIKPVLVAGCVGLALVPLAVTLFVRSGLYDVGASKRHSKLTEWLTHETMIHSVQRRGRAIAPPDHVDARQVLVGLCAYEAHCVACHGGAAVAREAWVSGMEPQPPYLLDVTRRFTPGELFWITKNGIKMTGMPAWGESMSDPQLWNVVAFLEAMPKMDPGDYLSLRAQRHCRVTGQ
jgi:mono/diheme cytochrome c family protein